MKKRVAKPSQNLKPCEQGIQRGFRPKKGQNIHGFIDTFRGFGGRDPGFDDLNREFDKSDTKFDKSDEVLDDFRQVFDRFSWLRISMTLAMFSPKKLRSSI